VYPGPGPGASGPCPGAGSTKPQNILKCIGTSTTNKFICLPGSMCCVFGSNFFILLVNMQWGINGARSACVFWTCYAETQQIHARPLVLQVCGPTCEKLNFRNPWKSCQAKGIRAGGFNFVIVSMLRASFDRVFPALLARTFLLFFCRSPKHGFGHETDRQKCYGCKNTG